MEISEGLFVLKGISKIFENFYCIIHSLNKASYLWFDWKESFQLWSKHLKPAKQGEILPLLHLDVIVLLKGLTNNWHTNNWIFICCSHQPEAWLLAREPLFNSSNHFPSTFWFRNWPKCKEPEVQNVLPENLFAFLLLEANRLKTKKSSKGNDKGHTMYVYTWLNLRLTLSPNITWFQTGQLTMSCSQNCPIANIT